MHVFRHPDITYEQEPVSLPHFSHHFHKQFPRPYCSQERPAFVATERVDRFAAARQNEVQIARSVMSFQIPRHHKRRIAHPFFQKEWGTLVLSLHGSLRKWYPPLVRLRHADKSGKSNSPPAGNDITTTYTEGSVVSGPWRDNGDLTTWHEKLIPNENGYLQWTLRYKCNDHVAQPLVASTWIHCEK